MMNFAGGCSAVPFEAANRSWIVFLENTDLELAPYFQKGTEAGYRKSYVLIPRFIILKSREQAKWSTFCVLNEF
jgi:hypothetical protein